MKKMKVSEMKKANGGFTYYCIWPCKRTFYTAIGLGVHHIGCIYWRRYVESGYDPNYTW